MGRGREREREEIGGGRFISGDARLMRSPQPPLWWLLCLPLSCPDRPAGARVKVGHLASLPGLANIAWWSHDCQVTIT